MPKVALNDSYVTIWRGKDCLSFIDGLSSNLVIGLPRNNVIQTAILDKNAKIIDFITILNLGEFLAVVGYASNFESMIKFVTPRILQSDVNISDISSLNDIFVSYDITNEMITGTCETIDGITHAKIYHNMTLCIASKNIATNCEEMDKEFHEWRIMNLIPWHGYEIIRGKLPYACGLNNFVHDAKGCYTGQEILTRMRTRNKGMKELKRIYNEDLNSEKITTKGDSYSLVIVNQ